MESITKKLLKELRKIGSSLTEEQSNFNFLSKYADNSNISKGFTKDCNVTFDDLEPIELCQGYQDEASWKIQNAVKDSHEKKIHNLKQQFNYIKSRLFLHAKNRAGKLFMRVKGEMKRLSDKLEKVKKKKLYAMKEVTTLRAQFKKHHKIKLIHQNNSYIRPQRPHRRDNKPKNKSN